MVAPTTVQGQPEPGHVNALDSVTTDRLQSFFERDDNSRLHDQRKETNGNEKQTQEAEMFAFGHGSKSPSKILCRKYIYITVYLMLHLQDCVPPHIKRQRYMHV